MKEWPAGVSRDALRLSLSVKELDAEVRYYLQARATEPTVTDGDADGHKDRIAEVILAQPGSLLAKEVRLSFLGKSLADFVIQGYNDA